MLVDCIEHYVNGSLIPKDQDHSRATVCKFIEKSEGEISLTDDIETIKINGGPTHLGQNIFLPHTLWQDFAYQNKQAKPKCKHPRPDDRECYTRRQI